MRFILQRLSHLKCISFIQYYVLRCWALYTKLIYHLKFLRLSCCSYFVGRYQIKAGWSIAGDECRSGWSPLNSINYKWPKMNTIRRLMPDITCPISLTDLSSQAWSWKKLELWLMYILISFPKSHWRVKYWQGYCVCTANW